MRIIFSLVLLLLFLYLHACNARNLVVLLNHQGDQNSQHPVFKEKDEKLNPGCVPMQNGEMKISVEAKSDDEQKNLEVMKDDGVINGSDLWRVPHRKRGEKDAGFNLDYLPPKTHPPVHN